MTHSDSASGGAASYPPSPASLKPPPWTGEGLVLREALCAVKGPVHGELTVASYASVLDNGGSVSVVSLHLLKEPFGRLFILKGELKG